jgi:hypothetical protein
MTKTMQMKRQDKMSACLESKRVAMNLDVAGAGHQA